MKNRSWQPNDIIRASAEPKWQKAWDAAKLFETKNDDPRPKYYVLEMFPYPSGRIHMGHVRNYTMGDVVARHRRALGYNVLHPMGWDAFGLPAENAARDNKVNPRDWTYAQHRDDEGPAEDHGPVADWAREFATCDPSLLQAPAEDVPRFLEAGLAERKSAKVNWDPEDMTVLANEQVIDGRGWRSGALVEQRDLTQWFFKITSMSQDLLDSLETLRQMAREGQLDAAELDRPLGRPADPLAARRSVAAGDTELEVYTTRPDTIFGASFMAIAADHPLAKKAAEGNPKLAAFIDEVRHMRHVGRGARNRREEGFRHRHPRRPSVRPGLDAAGLCREFRADGLRHGRHLRLPVGRPARPRLRQQIRPAGRSRWSCPKARTPRPSRSSKRPMSMTA